MNKIVLNLGLIFFFLAVIFFSQRELPFYEILLKSYAVFIFLTTMLSILGIVLIRSINKKALTKNNDLSENLSGN